MSPNLALCVALLTWQDLSIERVEVVAENSITREVVMVPVATMPNPAWERIGAHGFRDPSREPELKEIAIRLVRIDGRPWSEAEISNHLFAAHDPADSGPEVSIVMFRPESRQRVERDRAPLKKDAGVDLLAAFQNRGSFPTRTDFGLYAGGSIVAGALRASVDEVIEFRFDPEDFPGYARRVEVSWFDESGHPLASELSNRDVRLMRADGMSKDLAPANGPNVDRSGHRTDSFHWVLAGRYSLAVHRNSAAALRCAGEIEIPAVENLSISARVATPRSFVIVPVLEDRNRFSRLSRIRLVDRRGIDHSCAISPVKPTSSSTAPPANDGSIASEYRVVLAPAGENTIVLDGNAIPICIAFDEERVVLPRLRATRTMIVSVGPFRSQPELIEIDVCAPNGIRLARLHARCLDRLRGATDFRVTDDDVTEWTIESVPGPLSLKLRIDGRECGSMPVVVHDGDGNAFRWIVDR